MLSKKISTKEKDSPIDKQRRYTGYLIKTMLMSLLLFVFMSSCKKDDYAGEEKGVCPLVISTDPANKAVSIVANKAISATFNECMNPATIDTKSFILMQGTTPISGVVTAEVCPVVGSGYTGTFFFTPTSALAPFTLYTATMKKGVRDYNQNALQEDYVWSFTTQPQLILSSNPLIGGTTMGAGLFNVGSSVTALAIPAVGYSFKNWTEGTTIVSTSAEYIFPLAGNRTLVANFTAVPPQLTVTVSSNPLLGGTTTGGGAFDSGASVTVKAVPAAGYTFKNWTEGAMVVSTNADYIFTIIASRTLVANYTPIIPQFTVALSPLPLLGGSTTGGGTFNSGTSVTAKAVPAAGYTFKNWTEGATIVSTDANYTFTITSNRVMVANFTLIASEYTLTLSSNPLLGGTTTGGGLFSSGTSVTAKAVVAAGYAFKNWTEGATVVSTDANYTFNIDSNTALVANFNKVYAVTLSSNPLIGGTTAGAGTFTLGTSLTVRAFPAVGYVFTNWTEGGSIVSTDANYIFSITTNRALVANFTAVYSLTLSSNPLLSGTTTGAGSFNSGAAVTVKAVPAIGYVFNNWTEGGIPVSITATYTFNITSDRILVANFALIPPVGPGTINLGGAGSFSILTMSGISSTGVTSVQGDIGVSPAAAAAITGFGLIMDVGNQSSHTTIATHVTGKVYAADYAPPTPSNLTVAILDMQTAYTTANNLVIPAPVIDQGAGNLGGLTLAPGLYKWSTGVLIASGTTLTLSGGPSDTWVFQIAQDLTLNSAAKINLIGGAQAKNITWVVAGQAVLGTNTVLYGNILSKTLISLNTGAIVTGRLLAQTAVTLNTSTVIKP